MSQSKNLVWIFVIVLVLGGIYFFTKKPPITQAPTTTPTETMTDDAMMEEDKMMNEDNVIVAYTDDGFSPQSITVKVGSMVTFFNESTTDMWVASALHPTHQELPGFDQLKGEAAGSSYSFTFDQAGTWRFHDHLNPTAFGSVVVE